MKKAPQQSRMETVPRGGGPPKTKAGKRDIPLPPIVVNALKQWQPECPKGELVFATRAGKPQPGTNIHHHVWVPLLLKCGLTNEVGEHRYNFHLLRHAAASLFIAYLKWPPSAYRRSWDTAGSQ